MSSVGIGCLNLLPQPAQEHSLAQNCLEGACRSNVREPSYQIGQLFPLLFTDHLSILVKCYLKAISRWLARLISTNDTESPTRKVLSFMWLLITSSSLTNSFKEYSYFYLF